MFYVKLAIPIAILTFLWNYLKKENFIYVTDKSGFILIKKRVYEASHFTLHLDQALKTARGLDNLEIKLYKKGLKKLKYCNLVLLEGENEITRYTITTEDLISDEKVISGITKDKEVSEVSEVYDIEFDVTIPALEDIDWEIDRE